jgi:hypothetical protein
VKLDEAIEAKIDPMLRTALEERPPSDVLRVVVVLGTDASSHREGPEPKPTDFESRTAYREALIKRAQSSQASAQAPVREELQKLGLTLQGGHLGRALVVEGPASSVLEGLKLPGIRSATLDRPIAVDTPGRSGRKGS